jgi:hypothetical protein
MEKVVKRSEVMERTDETPSQKLRSLSVSLSLSLSCRLQLRGRRIGCRKRKERVKGIIIFLDNSYFRRKET